MPHGLNSFEVLKQCKSDFQIKIHEALLIKKHRFSLNKQYYSIWSWHVFSVKCLQMVVSLLDNVLVFPHEFPYFPLVDEL